MSESKLYLEIAVWSQVASSILFIAVLLFVWFRWLMPVLLAAQARSNRQIAQAEHHRDEVKGALGALREEIESARRDAELIAQRAELHAARERESIVAETKDAGERTLRDAAAELDRARAAARERLRDELVHRALEIARGDAVTRVGDRLDARLIERYAVSLEKDSRG
jgi:F0F1-type ATP synthase membrane subunit b/b'